MVSQRHIKNGLKFDITSFNCFVSLANQDLSLANNVARLARASRMESTLLQIGPQSGNFTHDHHILKS